MDNIIIQNLEIYAYHGVYPEENKLGQKFILTLELFSDLRLAGKTDELANSISYAEVCHFAETFLSKHRFQLIEACVEALLQSLFHQYPTLQKIHATLKKPWAPIGSHLEYAAVDITRSRHTVYLSLGSNLGDKEENLRTAIQALSSEDTTVTAVSSFYETEPWGLTDQPSFLNCAVALSTLLTPFELLKTIQNIESSLKRERLLHWGPRTIDLDILLYDDLVTDTPECIIPHPYMQHRLFVLEPLAEIAPWVVHPLLHQRIMDLKNTLLNTKER